MMDELVYGKYGIISELGSKSLETIVAYKMDVGC